MPDKWYETSARSSCTGVSLRWVAGAVDDTLIHVLSGAIEVTALKYGHVPRLELRCGAYVGVGRRRRRRQP